MPIINEYKNTIIDKLKPIPSYYMKRKEEEEERKNKEEQEINEMFDKCLDFYNDKYPTSQRKIEWTEKKVQFEINKKKNLKEKLDRCTEQDLYNLRLVILYNLKEHNYGPMKERDYIIKALNKVIERIPGGKYLEKIDRLKKKKEEQTEEIRKLEDRVKEERRIFLEKLEDIKNKDKKEEKIIDLPNEDNTNPTIEFKCSICNKICKSAAGLTSHKKTHMDNEV